MRRDQREQGAPVRRGDGQPALAGLKHDIKGQIESELIPVEAQALILVANVDVDRVNPKMWTLPLRILAGLLGGCSGELLIGSNYRRRGPLAVAGHGLF